MSQIRVAALGAGAWGKNVVRTLHQLGALALIVDPDAKRRAELAEQYPGVALAEGPEAAFNDPGIHAVAISTPVPTHAPLAEAAMRAGKDAFVEKPITLSAAEAEGLTQLAEAEGRVLMVGHLLMYQPAIAALREALKAGVIGKVYALHQERLNLGRARAVENVMWSFGVHDVAVLLDLVGEAPDQVWATGQRCLQPHVEDDVHLHLGFPSGVRAHLHTSWLWPEKRRRLTVVGSEGMFVLDEADQKLVLHRKGITEALANRDEGESVHFEGSGEPLALELQHFLDRIADRQAPRSDGKQGLAVVRVLEQAQKQLQTDAQNP